MVLSRPECEGPGFDSRLRDRMFLDHVSNLTQLDLVANVTSESEMHVDMLSPWRGECDSNKVS